MYLRVPSNKYKLCSTYGYLCKSISSVVPTSTSVQVISSVVPTGTFVVRVTPTGDLNKYKYAISTSISSVAPKEI